MAPSTPPPPSSVVFAALTIASTFSLVISLSTTSIRSKIVRSLISLISSLLLMGLDSLTAIAGIPHVYLVDHRTQPSTFAGRRANLAARLPGELLENRGSELG